MENEADMGQNAKWREFISSNNVKENRFLLTYPLIIFLSFFPTLAFASVFFIYFAHLFHPFILIIILPLLILLYYLIFILILFIICKLFLTLLNLVHRPKEGIFELSLKDRDYFFFCFRKAIKMLALEISNFFPLPWIKVLALKLSNIKVSTNTALLDSYIDTEFIELGEDTILGEGSIIMSSMIIKNYLIVKKVIIKERCTIGAYSVVTPGTILENNTILGGGSYTKINQHLEEGWVYIGRPARKLTPLDTLKQK